MNYTKTQHSAPYGSISPTRPALSAAAKTVLIAGASSGIAQATARAFLAAGTRRLILVSRATSTLAPLAAELEAAFPGAQVLRFAAGVLDAAALESAFQNAGASVDVVVNCAGYQPTLAPVAAAESDLEDWWLGFEVNVRGAATLARVVAARASPGAVLLQLGTAGAFFPAQIPSTLMPFLLLLVSLWGFRPEFSFPPYLLIDT